MSAAKEAGFFTVDSSYALTVNAPVAGRSTLECTLVEKHEGNEVRGVNLAPPSRTRRLVAEPTPAGLRLLEDTNRQLAVLQADGIAYRLIFAAKWPVKPGQEGVRFVKR